MTQSDKDLAKIAEDASPRHLADISPVKVKDTSWIISCLRQSGHSVMLQSPAPATSYPAVECQIHRFFFSNCKLRKLVSFIITSADKNLAILHGFVLKHRWYKPTYTSHSINNNETYRQKTNTPLSQIITTPFVNSFVREGHFWFCYSSFAESYSYLIGVTKAQFRQHLSDKNAVCDIWITFW